MEKKKKQPLKERNPYAYYRNGYVGLKAAKWGSIIAPFVTIFATKFNEYFTVADGSGNQVKLSLGCVLAMFVGGIAMYQETKKTKEDGTKTSSPVSNVVGWAVAFALCYLFQTILNDLTMIMGCALLGQLAGLGFEFGAENRAYYMKEYRSAEIQSKALSKANQQVIKTMFNKNKEETPYE